MNVNERGYKHLCDSVCVSVCVSSQLTSSLEIPPPHSSLPTPEAVSQRHHTFHHAVTCRCHGNRLFFSFLPQRPRNEMSLLLGGGRPSANKYTPHIHTYVLFAPAWQMTHRSWNPGFKCVVRMFEMTHVHTHTCTQMHGHILNVCWSVQTCS